MDTFDTVWAVVCVGVVVGILYGVQMTGIPTFALLGTMGAVTIAILGGGFVIFALIKAKQSTLSGAGLDWAGRTAKSRETRNFDKQSRRGHAAVLRNKIRDKWQKWRGKSQAITKWEWPTGYQPKSFSENRLLTFVLLDYALRLDTLIAKWYMIKKIMREKMQQLNNDLGRFGFTELEEESGGKSFTRSALRQDIMVYRSGGISSDGRKISGWASFDRVLLDEMNKATDLMFESIGIINKYNAEISRAKIPGKKKELQSAKKKALSAKIDELNAIRRRIDSAAAEADADYKQFLGEEGAGRIGRIEAFGVHHEIRSLVLNLYDMYNITGDYKHHYMITKPDAKFRINEHTATAGGAAPEGIEVDMFGVEVDKKNETEVGKSVARPQKLVNPKAMSYFIPNFLAMRAELEKAWYAYLQNFRLGEFAAKSRTTSDYVKAFEERIDVHLNDDLVKFTGIGGIKFDRRALANPGKIPFKGINGFGKIVPDNEYPMVTVSGIQIYLEWLIRAREWDSAKIIQDILARFPDDSKEFPNSEEELRDTIRYAKGMVTTEKVNK
ncbi:hypothetical protein HYX07_02245 [Candidatus Woesearchaeota archaeon]|nr:hypothetical protein [Candidatus Woesearchaeota archaeon]